MKSVAIIGGGLSGCVIAERCAAMGIRVDLFERRSHIGGNCHTYLDSETGIIIHKYGPHIFHTSNRTVWEYVNRFARFKNYNHRVMATLNSGIYSLPINLHTINQIYGKTLSPQEARNLIDKERLVIESPSNFEEKALSTIGRTLYEGFFREYTIKQWGTDPSELPVKVFSRLPVRFDYNSCYFDHTYQGMPLEGYHILFENLVANPKITVHLNSEFTIKDVDMKYDLYVCSAPIDEWYSYQYGPLRYRTLTFENSVHTGSYQGTSVMNYCSNKFPWTRITEHKYFMPWKNYPKTTISKEFSSEWNIGQTRYYPVRLESRDLVLEKYEKLAKNDSSTIFVGRLGTYRYLDMDKCIEESLLISENIKKMHLK